MANIIPFSNSGTAEVPAHLAALFGEEGNITARNTINQLSYRGKVWRRIVDGEETKLTKVDKDTGETIDLQIVSLVVLDHNKGRSRAFYTGGFEEGKNAKPDCYSGDGVKPDASVKEPCAPTCASCPNAVKGSKITEQGKQVTACSPFKRVAVVPTGKAIGEHPAMLLRLAQTSVWDKDNGENEAKGWYAWDQFLDMLRARGARHTAAVETRVKFDNRMAYPKLLFSAARWLNPDEAAAAKQRLADDTDAIHTILTGAGDNDGLAGRPATGTVPAQASPAGKSDVSDEDVAAVEAQLAAEKAEAAAAAAAKAEAEKKAKVAAEKKAKKEAAAKVAAEAAEAAAAAAAAAAAVDEDEDEEEAGTFAAPPAATPPAQTAAAKPTPGVEVETAAAGGGLASLLEGWDDEA